MRKRKEMIELSKKIDTVTTWNGRIVSSENCKKILNQYYEMNIDCFYVRDNTGKYRWFRLNTGKISYNYETKAYELTKDLEENSSLIKGIVDKNLKEGYFKFNPYTTVTLIDSINGGEIPCVSKKVAEENGYVEDFSKFSFIKTDNERLKLKYQSKTIVKYKGINKLAYNADANNSLYLKVIKEYGENKKFLELSPNTGLASKLIPYSFGIEYESSNGTIPKNLLGPLGVVPLKDGSLRTPDGVEPYEYTTIPLESDYGLETIKKLSFELSKRCEFNEKCSLHIHLGSLKKRTEEFVIAFYKLCYNLQNEVFSLFPAYKLSPEKYVSGFQKNYCQKLPDLMLDEFDFNSIKSVSEAKNLTKEAFDRIYYFLSDNAVSVTDNNFNLNSLMHPKGNLDKWNYHSRYMWVNLHPYMFSQKKTIEWRLHTPTFNHIKVSNWLFITSAIIQYAEQYTNQILRNQVSYTLSDILKGYINNFDKSFYSSDYNNNVSQYLIEYIEYRKQQMLKSFENKDYYGRKTIEYENDHDFTFNNGVLNAIY